MSAWLVFAMVSVPAASSYVFDIPVPATINALTLSSTLSEVWNKFVEPSVCHLNHLIVLIMRLYLQLGNLHML